MAARPIPSPPLHRGIDAGARQLVGPQRGQGQVRCSDETLHAQEREFHNRTMGWSILADALLVLHGLFIAWVAIGGLAVCFRPRLAWLHLPALAWGVWIEGIGPS